MQIVINIDDNVYKRALVYKGVQLASNSANDLSELITAVANGTPLPKGHGRLLDADKIESTLHNKAFDLAGSKRFYEIKWALKMVCDAPTIIEADKEVENDD